MYPCIHTVVRLLQQVNLLETQSWGMAELACDNCFADCLCWQAALFALTGNMENNTLSPINILVLGLWACSITR